ncbi:MAG: serine--tRNA ligase [bacterium]
MLDIKFIRQNPNLIKENCQKRGVKVDIDKLLKIDQTLREHRKKTEDWQAVLNHLSKSKPSAEALIEAKDLKGKIKDGEEAIKELEKELQDLLFQLPNLLLQEVPQGKGEEDNVVLREVGKKPSFNFKPKDYLEIAENLDLIDVKRAAKVSGTRFGYLKKEAALIEIALINLAFDVLVKEGFIPVIPPVMLRAEMAKGMGYLEQADKEEAYYLEKDDLYLAGTSEQSIGTMHAEETFQEEDLPRRYVAFSSCFRREAGAYGKDTKGILRVHQFDKVEMFVFSHPLKSKEEHQSLTGLEEKLMQLLDLPYRVVQLCSRDIGRPSANTRDIETWLPGQGMYRETHSASNCTDYQARRLNIRYRDSKTKQLEFVHTLNGTAFAIGRILIAIIENYQQKDGSVRIPKVLQK